MFIFKAREIDFFFHNQLECNKGRGFSILIIPVYSEGIRNNLANIKDHFKDQIKKMKLENPKSFDLITLDINPFIAIQNIHVKIRENILDCVIIAILNNPNSKNTKIFTAKVINNTNNKEIHINCSKGGISLRD